MYQLYKDDMWGNKVPFMVATNPVADMLVREMEREITRVVDVPRNVQELIKIYEECRVKILFSLFILSNPRRNGKDWKVLQKLARICKHGTRLERLQRIDLQNHRGE